MMSRLIAYVYDRESNINALKSFFLTHFLIFIGLFISWLALSNFKVELAEQFSDGDLLFIAQFNHLSVFSVITSSSTIKVKT